MSELSVLKSVTWDPAILAASLVANLLSLAVPLAMLQIYDRVIPNQAHETLIVLALMVAAALVVDAALRLSRARLLAYFSARFEERAYGHAFWSLIMEDPAHRRRVDSGTLVTRLSSIDRLRSQRADGAAAAMLDLPFAALFLIVMAILSPFVALTVTVTLMLTFIVLAILRHRIDGDRQNRLETEARRYSFFSEVLEGIRSVRALQIGDLMNRRQERLLARSAGHTRDMTRGIHMAQGLTAAVGNLVPLITAATAGYLVVNGQASIGVLAAVVVLSGRIVQPVLRFEGYLSSLESTRQSSADFHALTGLPQRSGGLLPLPAIRSVALRNVSTKPDPQTGAVLSGINLTLRPGHCVLLRSDNPGSISAGVRLFLGEQDLADGTIEVNDRPLENFRLEDRQERIRLLSEDAQLLEGSLLDNICAFRPEKYRTDALRLAQILGLQKIMRHSPRGVMTQVRADNDGLPQSAQRIASNICGLVTSPDLIVFHTANSGLDHDTDQKMLGWLRDHASQHILILVTNRPSYMSLATHTLDLPANRKPVLAEV
ncbi:ABC transporter transmembrane domain-containing protein [uncultured Roseobacter sp.]|uniref:ABC transporter transmembrane domain-containing protein n=1 Tax=uncultured Roseobacter sp. TaxID=114847 RepID=UPI00260A1379|nr:ABC transporter transmembrane domain-containing protein [uncultured Roseobacter sp.]